MALSKKRILKMVQDSKNRIVFSDFIAVGESDLYDYQPTRRAVLKEIAFMQCQDEDKKGPEGSPFREYVGWCYASQRYLAGRTGTTDDYVQQCTDLFYKDGIIKTRDWTDDWGTPHTEYQIIREAVDARKRPDGHLKKERKRPRRGGNQKANAGSFKAGNTAANRGGKLPSSQPYPAESTATATRVFSHEPAKSTAVQPAELTAASETAANSAKEVFNLGCSSVASRPSHLGCEGSGCMTIASDAASARPPAAVETSAGVRVIADHVSEHVSNKSLVQRMGKVTKGENVLLNKHTYVDLYEEWKSGGSGPLPKCRRCHATIQWNEPAHVCPGFIPKYGETDWDLREAKHDQLRESRLDDMHESRRSHACKACGEELCDEEEALAHMEDCPAR